MYRYKMWWMMESCLTSLPSNTSWKRANFRVTWSLSRDFSTVCMHAFRCFEYIIQEDLWLYSKAFIYLFAHDMFNSKVLKAFANIKSSVNSLHVSIKQWKKSFIIKHYELDLKNIRNRNRNSQEGWENKEDAIGRRDLNEKSSVVPNQEGQPVSNFPCSWIPSQLSSIP